MNKYIKCIVIVLIIGGAAFYGGVQYSQSQRVRQFGGRDQRNGGAGSAFISGTIVSINDKNIVLKANDGSSKTIFFSDATKIMHTVPGGAGDLTSGVQVSGSGVANDDGSISAESIQIRPVKNDSNNIK